jgi:mRNA interferase YafO
MKVTWNSASYAQFLQPTFDIKPDLKITLLNDFTSLKQGMYPAVFGKDGPYTAPVLLSSAFITFISCSRSKNEPAAATDSIAQATAHSFTVNMHISKMCIVY